MRISKYPEKKQNSDQRTHEKHYIWFWLRAVHQTWHKSCTHYTWKTTPHSAPKAAPPPSNAFLPAWKTSCGTKAFTSRASHPQSRQPHPSHCNPAQTTQVPLHHGCSTGHIQASPRSRQSSPTTHQALCPTFSNAPKIHLPCLAFRWPKSLAPLAGSLLAHCSQNMRVGLVCNMCCSLKPIDKKRG